jgi:uncharacterized protein (TIGR03067 family)
MENIMDEKLPARPNLDHLRRQAKSLLGDVESGDADAIATMQQHLPAAKGMSAQQVREAGFRLADAQSAVARKTEFAGWPHLARHVEQLRALEGSWTFTQLEVDGMKMPVAVLSASRILIDGDRFRTESPEATYEGIFNINVESEPHEIDIEFIEGPETGNWNYGIFRLESDQVEFCLDMSGKPRPAEFCTSPGSGHAYETLTRTSRARPHGVTGGDASPRKQAPAETDDSGFAFVESGTLTKLQGEWTPVKIVRDGQELPGMMLRTGRRLAVKNEVKISFGGQTMIHALVRLDETTEPTHIDYYNLGGGSEGAIQLGLLKWVGDEACFCMAAPGDPRPADFTCLAGSCRIFSQWRRKN